MVTHAPRQPVVWLTYDWAKTAVDFRSLYEFADRELNVGLADERLLGRSRVEARGVDALVRQIYCELRAKELSAGDRQIAELVAQVVAQEERMRTRKELNRWLWALACFAGFIGTLVFSWFALAAASKGTRFYALSFLSCLSFVLTLVSYVASRYHTDTE